VANETAAESAPPEEGPPNGGDAQHASFPHGVLTLPREDLADEARRLAARLEIHYTP
jgi:hypothetical protein